MIGLGAGDRLPEPAALFVREAWEEGAEVAFVVRTGLPGLEEENGLRDERGQSPAGSSDALSNRHRDAGLAPQDPEITIALGELDIKAEAFLRGRVQPFGQTPGIAGSGVDVGREREVAPVPGLRRVALHLCIVGD